MLSRWIQSRVGWGALTAIIATLAYRGIQAGTAGVAVPRAQCWTWGWLPFAPAWVWPYVSMFVIVGLPWFLLPSVAGAARFARHLLAMAAVGWVCFLVYPTACVRPPTGGQPYFYFLLQMLDGPNNCFPCLHAAMSVLAGWVLARDCPACAGRWVRLALAVWVAVIGVSIVALRQHTDVDTLAGVVLGGAVAWRWSAGRPRPEVV